MARHEFTAPGLSRTRPPCRHVRVRILVIGGTGVAGRETAAELVRRGHDVAVLSRRGGDGPPGTTPFAGDLVTGDGLPAALAGTECVVDCANVAALKRATAVEFFGSTTRRLNALARQSKVTHHVVLSIVGIDKVPLGYYAGKLAQEQALRDGPVPGTVLRATQFHEFVGQFGARLRIGPLHLTPDLLMQPVAMSEVAQALADLVEAGPGTGRAPDVAGPRRERLPDLTRRLRRHQGRRAAVLRVPLTGGYGRAVRAGGLLPEPGAVLRGPTFTDWLASRPPAAQPRVQG